LKFLSTDLVLLIARRQTERFGGIFGVRDLALLESAVAAPEFASYYGADLVETAARYLHIASNHPHRNGNKRTAAAAMLLFLEANGSGIAPTHQDQLGDFILAFVEGRMAEDALVRELRTLVVHQG